MLVVLGLLVLGGTAQIVAWANGPNTTRESQIGTSQIIPTSKEVNQDQIPLSSTYFTTALPHDFRTVSSSETAGQLQILTASNTSGGTSIAFTSRPTPPEGIEGVGDYNMRRGEASGYTMVPPDGFGGAAKYVFRKPGTTPEMTAFIPHGSRYLIIAITGGTESLQAEQMQLVLGGLKWST